MQARRGRYFQMRRWEKNRTCDFATDCSFVRVFGESDDPRFTRLMQEYCVDKLGADCSRRAARRILDADLEAFVDPRGGSVWD